VRSQCARRGWADRSRAIETHCLRLGRRLRDERCKELAIRQEEMAGRRLETPAGETLEAWLRE
jgi:hypothetical protein